MIEREVRQLHRLRDLEIAGVCKECNSPIWVDRDSHCFWRTGVSIEGRISPDDGTCCSESFVIPEWLFKDGWEDEAEDWPGWISREEIKKNLGSGKGYSSEELSLVAGLDTMYEADEFKM